MAKKKKQNQEGSGVDSAAADASLAPQAPELPAGMVAVTLVGGPFAGETRIVPENYAGTLMEGGEHGPGYLYVVNLDTREATYQTSAAEVAKLKVAEELRAAEEAGEAEMRLAPPPPQPAPKPVVPAANPSDEDEVVDTRTTLEDAIEARFGKVHGRKHGVLARLVSFYEPHRQQIEADAKAAWGVLPYPPANVFKPEG